MVPPADDAEDGNGTMGREARARERGAARARANASETNRSPRGGSTRDRDRGWGCGGEYVEGFRDTYGLDRIRRSSRASSAGLFS